MRRDAPAEAGFTLFETLVAMTVLALLASALLRGVVAVRADAAWFDARTAGRLLATSVLDEAAANRMLRDGVYRGSREGRRWVLTATAPAVADQLSDPQPAPATGDRPAAAAQSPVWRPQRLTVAVEATSRPIVVETVHLVAPP